MPSGMLAVSTSYYIRMFTLFLNVAYLFHHLTSLLLKLLILPAYPSIEVCRARDFDNSVVLLVELATHVLDVRLAAACRSTLGRGFRFSFAGSL